MASWLIYVLVVEKLLLVMTEVGRSAARRMRWIPSYSRFKSFRSLVRIVCSSRRSSEYLFAQLSGCGVLVGCSETRNVEVTPLSEG